MPATFWKIQYLPAVGDPVDVSEGGAAAVAEGTDFGTILRNSPAVTHNFQIVPLRAACEIVALDASAGYTSSDATGIMSMGTPVPFTLTKSANVTVGAKPGTLVISWLYDDTPQPDVTFNLTALIVAAGAPARSLLGVGQ